jgi:hypothetical protein
MMLPTTVDMVMAKQCYMKAVLAWLKHADIVRGQVDFVLIQRLGEHCGFDDVGMKLFSLMMKINDLSEIEEMLETHSIPFTSQGTSLTKQPRAVDLGTSDESVSDDAFEASLDEIQTAVRRDIRNSQSHNFEPGTEYLATSQSSPLGASHIAAGFRLIGLTFDLKFGSITKARAEITDCT